MRFIDLSIIENKVKKIPWTSKLNTKYSHLSHLSFEENGDNFIDWFKIEEFHLAQLEAKTAEERKAYIKAHSDWNILLPLFIKEYGNKCWYSEAPLDKGIIDHFRPKNKAINYCLDETDIKHKFILKQDGYWRLAYNLFNFRVASDTSNTRFDDMEAEDVQIGGKSIYFPLKCEENGNFIVADKYDDIIAEKSLLLDPLNKSDYSNISFEKSGEPIVSALTEMQKLKAEVSINLYNLRNTLNFVDERQKVWFLIEQVINETKKHFDSNLLPDESKLKEQDNCFDVIRRHTDQKAFFSGVAHTCLRIHQIKPGYEFLLNFKS